MTLNFWRMCTANLLLFISVYMLFPLLPFVMGEQLGVSVCLLYTSDAADE